MFVCHGNICRSPMAEFVLKDMVNRAGISERFLISSAATSTAEIHNGVGDPVYPPARVELLRHGLSCEGKRAVQLSRSDYDKYDVFVCMDDANVADALKILGDDPEKKVKKLLSYTESDRNVADPWYTKKFETAYNDILEGCRAMFEYYSKQ